MGESENGASRNQALDFAKGILVLFMILYHWINYFVSIGGPVFRYLRFVPPSFIFVAGFLIANVYPAKYELGEIMVYKRLMVRGLKLLTLFTLLNVIANLLFVKSYGRVMPGLDGFLRDAATIYISGNAKAAFGVLVPISYLLLLSAGIFAAGRICKCSVHLACAASLLFMGFLEWKGFASSNVMLVGIGLLGVVVGLHPIEKINVWVDCPYVLVGLNVAYIVAISIWEVNSLLQIIGVCLSVTSIYLVGMKSVAWGGVRNLVILLGRYSLFGYIAQIGLLQLLHRGIPYLNWDSWSLLILSFISAFLMTITAVGIMQWSREKSNTVDRLYRVTFT